MGLKEKVIKILESLDLSDPEIKVFENSRFRVVGRIVSSTFDGMSDGDRQHLVWGKLVNDLTDREQEWIEFVFTKSPSEVEEVRSSRESAPTELPA